MNSYDSDKIISLMNCYGFSRAQSPDNAQLILLNTCSIRKKPEEKIFSELGRMRQYKLNDPGVIIGVTGCVAQQMGKDIFKRCEYVDFVIGPACIHHLPMAITKIENNEKHICFTENSSEIKEMPVIHTSTGQNSAMITIMRGCDNFCSYCIVPFVRGREVSRPFKEIINEIKTLANRGVKDITLLGQNVNSYGLKYKGFPLFHELLEKVAEIDGIERIRFTTSHPKDLSDGLIMAFKKNTKLCNHIHLPVQSGSNRILKKMNRGYTREQYLEKISDLLSNRPDISISTDIITGFPGETEEDFNDTLSLLEKVRFDSSFSFIYSDRPFTKASTFSDKVAYAEKLKRLKIFQEIQKKITLEKNLLDKGKIMKILINGESRRGAGQLTGRTSSNKVVNIKGHLSLSGKFVDVMIEDAGINSLTGILVEKEKNKIISAVA